MDLRGIAGSPPAPWRPQTLSTLAMLQTLLCCASTVSVTYVDAGILALAVLSYASAEMASETSPGRLPKGKVCRPLREPGLPASLRPQCHAHLARHLTAHQAWTRQGAQAIIQGLCAADPLIGKAQQAANGKGEGRTGMGDNLLLSVERYCSHCDRYAVVMRYRSVSLPVRTYAVVAVTARNQVGNDKQSGAL